KGHIEKGESPGETAAREVREEAGVEATVVRYAGIIEFDSPKGEHVRAGYFLMDFLKEVEQEEDREIRWCSIPEALSLVKFEDTRRLIPTAEQTRLTLDACASSASLLAVARTAPSRADVPEEHARRFRRARRADTVWRGTDRSPPLARAADRPAS